MRETANAEGIIPCPSPLPFFPLALKSNDQSILISKMKMYNLTPLLVRVFCNGKVMVVITKPRRIKV